jgi:hypothetical protein
VGPDLDLDELAGQGAIDLPGTGWYRRLLHLGTLDGFPVATITSADEPPLHPAGPAYLGVVADGLRETWGLDRHAAATYLAGRPGNRGSIEVDRLAADLAHRVHDDNR